VADKPVIIIGVPTMSLLFRGFDVHLESAVLIPDSQVKNLSVREPPPEGGYGSAATANNSDYTPPLCKRCPYSGECKQGEVPGSNHCFAVLQRLNPLEAEDCV